MFVFERYFASCLSRLVRSMFHSAWGNPSFPIQVARALYVLKSLNIVSRHKLQQDSMRYRVTIERDEDGIFIAECPTLPGCVSEGKTRNEALSNIKDAIQGYLASLRKHHEPIPPPIEEEMVEVSA